MPQAVALLFVVALLAVARQPAERLGLCKAKQSKANVEASKYEKHASEGGKQNLL